MPSLITNDGRLIAFGSGVTQTEEHFIVRRGEYETRYPKPMAQLVDQEPESSGVWVWREDQFVDATPPKPEVPQVVSMRQAKIALAMSEPIADLGANALESINQAIDSLPEPEKTIAKITWEYATEVERSNSLIRQVQTALSVSDEAIDDLFISAGRL